MTDARRSIPSVDRLLSSDAFAELQRRWPRDLVVSTLQDELAALRLGVAPGSTPEQWDEAALAQRVNSAIERLAAGSLVPVINATGVVLHTNLGRAPLADAALDAVAAVSRGYSNLEYDMETGTRGSRYTHCRALLCRLTAAQDALIVNNNAAALVLALNTFSRGLDAVVSRGELVEIGGAFRVPDILARSGARLREVGSTNRTHIDDYRDAAGVGTGALLKVHPSNFAMAGYTAEVTVRELAPLAAAAGVPLIHDIGSGLLLDPAQLGLPAEEPTPRTSLADGASLVTMSGDKLLGGPQAGIILGRTDLLERMRRNPLCRALRVDKLTLAALAATLQLYLDPAVALREVPVLRMLALPASAIQARAVAMTEQFAGGVLRGRVITAASMVGGGAAATATLPTALLLVGHSRISASALEQRLRAGRPAVVTRIVEDHVAIDLRTVRPEEDGAVLRALEGAAAP